MIRLHYSNRLDELIEPLADNVGKLQRTNPFAPVTVVVPTRAVEQFVKFRLADRLGVAANLKFPFLNAHLADIARKCDPALEVIDADALQFAIFEFLRDPANRAKADLGPVYSYASSAGADSSITELRMFELCGRIAAVFREYALARRTMIDAWRARSYSPRNDVERWQRRIWLEIFDGAGMLAPRLAADTAKRAMLLPYAFRSIPATTLEANAPRYFSLFGVASIGEGFVEIVDRLGKIPSLTIDIFAFNPCREFWEDLDTSRRSEASHWAKRRDRVAESDRDGEDPYELGAGHDPLALEFWGRPGRESIRMLGELVEDFDARFIDPVAPPVGSTLHVLQRDILDRRPHLPPVETGRGIPPDSSIRILACAGIRREVEAIANEIWTAMKSRTGADRIRFHEIAIAIPDTARDAYIADIEAVFRRIHGIPIEIVSRYGAGASRVAEAFAMILDLPLGRFTRGQMLALMLHPSIARAAQAPDSATLARWLEEAGVFFQSASGDDGGAYAGGTFEWDQALARMAAGTAMRADFADASARVVDSAQRRLIPIEIAQDLSASAAWTIRTARGVIADAIAMRTASLALSDWSKLFEEIAATYIASADAGDDRARGELAEAIASIVPEGIQSAAVGFGVARALVLGRIGGLESRRGRLASTGVAVGTVTQLQSIPFKIIFVPAIGEGIFPVRDARDEIDLRRIARRAGDVWPAERDRYLFLQCLMAARESIVLSYVARDPASGDVREPSAIVSELRYILSGYLDANGVAALTIDHPASRYDLSYFPDLARAAGVDLKKTLTSYDAEAHHAARMSAIRADFVRACGIGALATDQNLIDVIDPAVAAKILPMTRTIADPPEIDQARERDRYDVTLSALRRFLECPAQGSARRALGMEDEDGDEIELEHEPFALDNLNHANILREAIAARAGISGVDSAYRAQLEIAQARGVAPAGIFAQAQTESDVTLMRQWIAAASSCGIADLSEWRRIRFGPGDEVATDARAFDRIELDAMVNGRAVKIAIHGQSELFSPELERSIKFVAHKDANAKDRLGMALGAIALAASGNAPAKEFNAIVIAGNEEKVSAKAIAFDLPDASSAREYLADLAGDMLSGLHDYFIPIDAIDSGHAEAEESVRAAFKLRAENARRSSNSHHHCSSDYGPLASVHELRPPDDARAQEIIESRFGPILAIFDRAERKRK